MKCKAKHVWAPDEWLCPKCGADNEHFYIDDWDARADESCPELHAKDIVICTYCKHSWTGNRLSKLYQQQHDIIPCPHCNGKGVVKK